MSNIFVTREILRVDAKTKWWYEMLLPTLKLCTEVDETEHDKHSKKYLRTWCIKWISYYCISYIIIFVFMNTPTISAIAINKGKHSFQKTLLLSHVKFLLYSKQIYKINIIIWNVWSLVSINLMPAVFIHSLYAYHQSPMKTLPTVLMNLSMLRTISQSVPLTHVIHLACCATKIPWCTTSMYNLET